MNWLNFSFVILIVIALLLFVYGLKSKSQLSIFFGGIALITPLLYFSGIHNWVVILPLVPATSLAISHFAKKKLNTT